MISDHDELRIKYFFLVIKNFDGKVDESKTQDGSWLKSNEPDATRDSAESAIDYPDRVRPINRLIYPPNLIS